jgi:hypothetical protein
MALEETLIIVFVPSVFMLITILILDRNWFKRERFKVDMNFSKKKNDLEFKKLARDLGLQNVRELPAPQEKTRGAGLAAAVLPELLKNMDPDTLANIATNLIGTYAGGGGEETGGGGIGDILGDLIANNPEIVQSFLGGLKSGKENKVENFTPQV